MLYLPIFAFGCRSLDFLHYAFNVFPVSITKVGMVLCGVRAVQLAGRGCGFAALLSLPHNECAGPGYPGLSCSPPWLILDFMECIPKSSVYPRILDQFGLERNLKIIQFYPCHRQDTFH